MPRQFTTCDAWALYVQNPNRPGLRTIEDWEHLAKKQAATSAN